MSLFLPPLSFVVVVRRLAFAGVGLSHSAFAGIALALLLGVHPVLGALLVAVGVAFLLAKASDKGVPEDAAIGVLFAGSMAAGAVLLSLYGGTRVELWAYLFGNILSVSNFDLWFLGAAAAVSLGFFFGTKRNLLLVAFNRELALAEGVNVPALNLGLMTVLAVAVIASVKAVGIVLASGLLVLPAAVGTRLSPSARGSLALSWLVGAGVIFGGLGLSWWLDLPSGATIMLLGTAVYLATLIKRR